MKGTYSEEEFRQVLKNLFSEKSDVSHLKDAYHEKEQEAHTFKNQIERIRPALKKLLSELQAVKDTLALTQQKNALLEEKLSQAEKHLASLESEKQEVLSLLSQKNTLLETERTGFEQTLAEFKTALEEKQRDHLKVKALEEERGGLVVRLADTLSQLHNQTELITTLKKETKTCGPECESRLRKLYEELSEKERRHQEALEIAYAKFKEYQLVLTLKEEKISHLLTQCGEKDQEIRKAQLLLAKKVKETTISTDLLEKQKRHLLEIRTLINKVYSENETPS